MIENQKQIAKEVLNKLEITDPNCILAGGAPRDWWFEQEANDLDFYVYWGENSTTSADLHRLKLLGFEDVKPLNRAPLEDIYGTIPELNRVWELTYKGQKVQVMVMDKSTFNCVVNRFGTSVCMAWWKGNGVRVTSMFLESHLSKTLYVKDDYNAKTSHVMKMQDRYPDYVKRPYSEYSSEFLSNSKTPLWVLSNLGENQNYKRCMDLYLEGEE